MSLSKKIISNKNSLLEVIEKNSQSIEEKQVVLILTWNLLIILTYRIKNSQSVQGSSSKETRLLQYLEDIHSNNKIENILSTISKLQLIYSKIDGEFYSKVEELKSESKINIDRVISDFRREMDDWLFIIDEKGSSQKLKLEEFEKDFRYKLNTTYNIIVI